MRLYLFWRGKRSIKCHWHIEIGNFDYTEYINPLPGMESVTNVPVEEDSIIGAREPTSPMFKVRLSQEKWTRIISTTCEEDFVCQGTRRSARRRRWHRKRCYWWENTLFPSDSQSSQQKDHWKQEQGVKLECPSTIKIKDRGDVVFGVFEFHVEDILSDL